MGKTEEKFLSTLEKLVIAKMGAIKRRELLPQESEIGVQLNRIKLLDQACYEKLLREYKQILKSFQNEQN